MLLFNGEGEFYSSVIRALAYIGPVLFGFYIGSLIDKTDKRLSGFIVSLVIALIVAIFGLSQSYNNHFFTVSFLFLMSVLTYFLNNLRVTVLPLLIKESHLSNTNSILLIIENIALLAAPAVSAFLLKVSSPQMGIFYLSICFFISSIIYLLSLKGFELSSINRVQISFLDSFYELLNNKKLVVNVLAMMGSNAFVGVFTLYIMIHAYNSGLFAEDEAPFILISSGIGAIISGFFATKVINTLGASRLVITCGLLMGLVGISPLLWHSKEVYYISAFFEGLLSSWLVICVWTIRQKSVSKEILGRVTGLTSSLFKLSMIVSIPLAGWIATNYDSSFSLISASIWVIVFIIPIFFQTIRSPQLDVETENSNSK